jgi:large subunit ribosomal protein L10
VKSITDLRRRLRNAGVEYLVVKNTLAERALEGSDLPDIAEFFRGPTAVVIGRTTRSRPPRCWRTSRRSTTTSRP